MIPLVLGLDFFNALKNEGFVIKPFKLGVLGKFSVGCLCSTLFYYSPSNTYTGIALKISAIAFVSLNCFYQKEITLYERTSVWNPPLKQSFNIPTLESFSYNNCIADFIIKFLVLRNINNKKNLLHSQNKIPDLKNIICSDSQLILNYASFLKKQFLDSHPELNDKKYIPSIEFTAMVISIQVTVDENDPLIIFIELLDKLKGNLRINTLIDFNNDELNECAKTLQLTLNQLQKMQYLFLKEINWNVNQTYFKDGNYHPNRSLLLPDY